MAATRTQRKPSADSYEITHGGETRNLVRVTRVLSALAKPALIPWAAGQERDAVLLALREILARDPALLVHASPETVVEAVQGRMGYARAHLKTTRDAMDIGTQAHALIQEKTIQMMGGESRGIGDVSDAALSALILWEDWTQQVGFVPILCEQRVYHWQIGYAGTVDCVAEITHHGERVRAMIDYKTGKAVYQEAHLQLAAYMGALEWMMAWAREEPIEQAWIKTMGALADVALIVRLPKTLDQDQFHADRDVVEVTDWRSACDAFWALVEVWTWQMGCGP